MNNTNTTHHEHSCCCTTLVIVIFPLLLQTTCIPYILPIRHVVIKRSSLWIFKNFPTVLGFYEPTLLAASGPNLFPIRFRPQCFGCLGIVPKHICTFDALVRVGIRHETPFGSGCFKFSTILLNQLEKQNKNKKNKKMNYCQRTPPPQDNHVSFVFLDLRHVSQLLATVHHLRIFLPAIYFS